MFKFPFVLRSKYERLERESQWIAGQLTNTRREAEMLHNELQNCKASALMANQLFRYYKRVADRTVFQTTHPRSEKGRFIPIEVK